MFSKLKSRMLIPDPGSGFFSIPDPGVKKTPDPGVKKTPDPVSGSATQSL
jgi:hypothetical protein